MGQWQQGDGAGRADVHGGGVRVGGPGRGAFGEEVAHRVGDAGEVDAQGGADGAARAVGSHEVAGGEGVRAVVGDGLGGDAVLVLLVAGVAQAAQESAAGGGEVVGEDRFDLGLRDVHVVGEGGVEGGEVHGEQGVVAGVEVDAGPAYACVLDGGAQAQGVQDLQSGRVDHDGAGAGVDGVASVDDGAGDVVVA